MRYHPTLEGAKQLIAEAKKKMKDLKGKKTEKKKPVRDFSLYSETEEIDSCGDEVIGSRWLITSDDVTVLFDHIKVLLKEDKDWVFKIVRDAEETE